MVAYNGSRHESAQTRREDWFTNSMLSGFVATVGLTAATVAAYGISRWLGRDTGNQMERWLYALSHNRIIDRAGDSLVLAIGLNLIAGLVFAVIYGMIEHRIPLRRGYQKGMAFSLLLWLLSITLFFSIMDVGLFGTDLNAGPLAILGNLALHLVGNVRHFIGHLQSNKINALVPYISCLETLDRLSLARKLENRLAREGETLEVLVQVNTSGEPTKAGLDPDEVEPFIRTIAGLDALKVRRIGHGVRAAEDADLMRRLAVEGIVLELCPGSNIALGLYPDWAAHPVARLRTAGVAVTLSTDDPPWFHTGLPTEYARLAATFRWTAADFRAINRTAAAAAFCDEDTRATLIARLESEDPCPAT